MLRSASTPIQYAAQYFSCKIFPSAPVFLQEQVVADPNFEFRRLVTGAGWHQARAARELGLTTGTVSRYWSGEAKPSVPVLRLLSQLVGEPFIDQEVEYRPSALRDGPRWLEDWEVDVITDLRRLSPEPRRKVIRALRDLLEAAAKTINYRKSDAALSPFDKDPVERQVEEELRNEIEKVLSPAPRSDKTKRRVPNERQQPKADGG